MFFHQKGCDSRLLMTAKKFRVKESLSKWQSCIKNASISRNIPENYKTNAVLYLIQHCYDTSNRLHHFFCNHIPIQHIIIFLQLYIIIFRKDAGNIILFLGGVKSVHNYVCCLCLCA